MPKNNIFLKHFSCTLPAYCALFRSKKTVRDKLDSDTRRRSE